MVSVSAMIGYWEGEVIQNIACLSFNIVVILKCGYVITRYKRRENGYAIVQASSSFFQAL